MANRLSKQILSLIFIEGAAADWRWRRSSPSSSTRHQHEFRDIVTWVCRSWRSAALSTPEIWARIDVSTPNLSPRVPLYIARTGSTERPVHIHLDANRHFFQETDSDDWEHRSDRLRGTLEEIVNDGCGTELWKTLHLNIVSEVDTWATVFFLNGSAFPNLESFTFIGYQHPRIKLEERLDTLTPIISDPEPDESKLRSVHLKRFSMNFLAECQVGTTVLSRLTCLELELLDSAPSVSQLCQMLSHNPNLKIFRLTLGNDLPKQKPKKQAEDDDGMDVDESVALPLLEELSLKDSRSAQWTHELLSTLSAPNVKKFWLSWHKSCSDNMRDVTSLLTRGPAFPTLQHLATNISRRPLKAIMHTYSNIQKLTLLPGHDMGGIIELTQAPWLSPHLAHVGVSNCTQDAPRIAQMIQERRAYGTLVPVVVAGSNIYDHYFD